MPGNSPLFKNRLKRLSNRKNYTPRVPRKYRGEAPEHHSDLFTDENPKRTVHGLRFRNSKEAIQSVTRLKKLYKSKKITYAHMRQIGLTMEQRSRYHSHPTKGIKEGNKIWKKFNNSFKKK
jgi:predicted GIY-YIG superfamily endonuclease